MFALLWMSLQLPLLGWNEFARTEVVNPRKDTRPPEKIKSGQRMEGAVLDNEDLKHSMLAGVHLKKAKTQGCKS